MSETGLIGRIGGPGRDRTDDLFHAMEARSQLRHRPTCEREIPLSRNFDSERGKEPPSFSLTAPV
jgi:hypothetical protein